MVLPTRSLAPCVPLHVDLNDTCNDHSIDRGTDDRSARDGYCVGVPACDTHNDGIAACVCTSLHDYLQALQLPFWSRAGVVSLEEGVVLPEPRPWLPRGWGATSAVRLLSRPLALEGGMGTSSAALVLQARGAQLPDRAHLYNLGWRWISRGLPAASHHNHRRGATSGRASPACARQSGRASGRLCSERHLGLDIRSRGHDCRPCSAFGVGCSRGACAWKREGGGKLLDDDSLTYHDLLFPRDKTSTKLYCLGTCKACGDPILGGLLPGPAGLLSPGWRCVCCDDDELCIAVQQGCLLCGSQ
mmetsp:Transcript_55606/g.178395  ORF Transcript_55606/g.178395 Transcript_55606/m.178395 type:complete len:302 (-) Transcript_55606:352-1257(-)